MHSTYLKVDPANTLPGMAHQTNILSLFSLKYSGKMASILMRSLWCFQLLHFCISSTQTQGLSTMFLFLFPGFLCSQDGQSRTVRQFQFTDWPEQGVPKSGEGFIDFIGQVHKTKEQFGQDGPISVHCR